MRSPVWDETLMSCWGELLVSHVVLGDEPPEQKLKSPDVRVLHHRPPSSHCSSLAALPTSLVCISSVSSPTALISDIRKTVTTLVNLVEDYIVQYVVSTPLLAAQSQAGWGAGVTFPGGLCSLGTFPPECPLPLGCQLLLPSFTQPAVGRRGGGI